MGQKKPSVDLLDREFSRYVRTRDNFTCQRCATQYAENATGLHCSHFIGRANRATRWDLENCDALCNGCHQYFETHKATKYREWKRAQLGDERFELLVCRSIRIKKWNADDLVELRASWRVAA